MLQITIPAQEWFDERMNEFISTHEYKLTLEHSLVSISKWEAKWKKPFLNKEAMTLEQTIDYIKCMTITQNVNPKAYNFITSDNIKEVSDYISSDMTATWFHDEKVTSRSSEQVTSELIYYWMIALNIPMECQKWHLSRLLTLIRVCNIKNQPPKKMNKKDIMRRNASLNATRRKRMNSKG